MEVSGHTEFFNPYLRGLCVWFRWWFCHSQMISLSVGSRNIGFLLFWNNDILYRGTIVFIQPLFCALCARFIIVCRSFLYKLNLTRPPGNFFFIMLASMAICTPFHLESIPEKVGYVAIGTILTCALGLIYSLLTLKETHETEIKFPQKKYTPTL